MNTQDLMREALRAPKGKTLDSADEDPQALSGADQYTLKDIAIGAAAAVQQWAETDDLDEGEGYADRLLSLLVGIADANHDGEITEDEQGVLDAALNAAWDYLSQLGGEDADIDTLLNDWDEDAAGRLRELVASALPEGEDAAAADIDGFVFGPDAKEAVFDAVYKKVMAVRGGRKVRIRKRVSGTVRLSAKQKLAIRKARMKSHSAGAQMHRMKSLRLRRRVGL